MIWVFKIEMSLVENSNEKNTLFKKELLMHQASSFDIRQRMAVAVKNLPLSQLFFQNPTFSCGLNLCDFVVVQRFPMAARMHSMTAEAAQDLGEFLGDVYLGDSPLQTVGELWDRFLAMRKDLVWFFSDGKFQQGISLEDVILIDKMFRCSLLKGNLHVDVSRIADQNTYCSMKNFQSTQSLVALFHDLSCFCYVLPADQTTEQFLVEVDGTLYSMCHTILEIDDFLRQRQGWMVDPLYREFVRRIKAHACPEFAERFWKCFVEACGGWQRDTQKNRATMQRLGIDDAIVYIDDDPSLSLHVLQDTLKNSIGMSIDILSSRLKERSE
ncbi:MAG: hypothetical protein A3B74_03280 [Candidatus Kerfeldbacteria bacterium RIFCSPHIGHO2_02_FULL_42_14]|uniref:Uncharacterized protein n=1 Tax=Candidatus Kerfeldbacteria bacterium RIFCSPHIGHO2_02_FULL_42_14 TaxID=1798540 RepID=A0A1G2AQL0_9BACT|nr:MAG: hypothetical protein A3B74_03280 [Candidatus Kerfeldbacteria bacterium RIFCSPHIGHO2_02_FULL_42_14]OGY87295.1 MAG: hypothetical protein A3G01_03070 [Candidatus Kerfeldbacteria bacterium RIFCSPLOWO2_12_FULL_43_9]